MPSDREVEIKFQIADIETLTSRLEKAGFALVTPRTHELNTLYDRPGGELRGRGALLRLRQYGPKWTLTYKDKGNSSTSRPKSRRGTENYTKEKSLPESDSTCVREEHDDRERNQA